MTTKTSYPLDHPVYVAGECTSAQDCITKVNDRFKEYSSEKYVNFVGLSLVDLPIVQKYFEETHTITNTAGKGSRPYYEVRPKKKD